MEDKVQGRYMTPQAYRRLGRALTVSEARDLARDILEVLADPFPNREDALVVLLTSHKED